MGFRYFDYGSVLPCGVENGSVYFKMPAGKLLRYPCSLTLDIHAQCNLFTGATIAFLLEEDGLEYIGRFDGTVSIIRKEDGLLVGLNSWEPPTTLDVRPCGMFHGCGIHARLYQDLRDYQTLHVHGWPISGRLTKPYMDEFDEYTDLVSSAINKELQGHVYTLEGGELLASENWIIQEDIWRRNCRIFV